MYVFMTFEFRVKGWYLRVLLTIWFSNVLVE